jgi:hypothetical protein
MYWGNFLRVTWIWFYRSHYTQHITDLHNKQIEARRFASSFTKEGILYGRISSIDVNLIRSEKIESKEILKKKDFLSHFTDLRLSFTYTSIQTQYVCQQFFNYSINC